MNKNMNKIKEWFDSLIKLGQEKKLKVINDTSKYWNQYYDVKDILKTPEIEPLRTCGITSASMITGENPNNVLRFFIDKYGYEIGAKEPHFKWEGELIKYLRCKDFKCKEVTHIAWPKSRFIKNDELGKMIKEIRKGNIIFYHKAGHYQLMIGFEIDQDENMINFIFNDPSGNRKITRAKRKRESGHNVVYPYDMIKAEKIYGRCWSVEI